MQAACHSRRARNLFLEFFQTGGSAAQNGAKCAENRWFSGLSRETALWLRPVLSNGRLRPDDRQWSFDSRDWQSFDLIGKMKI